MAPMVSFDVGQNLNREQQLELEQRLEKRLGVVSCVRHPPAIDDVRVTGDDQTSAKIAISACCELTTRRAKIIVTQVLGDYARTGFAPGEIK
jgi:hypothetical protein